QMAQPFGGGGERLVALGEAEARQLRGARRVGVEGGGRDGGDADLRGQPAAEGDVVREAERGDVGQQEVAPADRQDRQPGVRERRGEAVAARGVLGAQLVVVAALPGRLQRGGHRVLEGGGGGEGDELVDRAQRRGQGRRPDSVAD